MIIGPKKSPTLAISGIHNWDTIRRCHDIKYMK